MSAVAGLAGLALLLGGCGGDQQTEAEAEPDPQETAEGEPEPEEEPEYEPPSIAEHAAEATWQFSPRGLNAPLEVALSDGEAQDVYIAYRHRPDLGEEMDPDIRSEEREAAYTMGEPIEGDLTGDGVTDAVIPLTAAFGEDSETLWYVWFGTEDPGEGDPVAEQHPYPVAAAQECGNDVADVRIEDGALHLEVSDVVTYHSDWECDGPFAYPHEHDHRPRTVEVEEHDGEPTLVQTAPARGWGGVCPGTDSPEWFPLQDMEVTLTADPGSETLVEMGEPLMLGGFFLGEDPLVATEGEERILTSVLAPDDSDDPWSGEVVCGWMDSR